MNFRTYKTPKLPRWSFNQIKNVYEAIKSVKHFTIQSRITKNLERIDKILHHFRNISPPTNVIKFNARFFDELC